jgi:hypothetical protein
MSKDFKINNHVYIRTFYVRPQVLAKKEHFYVACVK